MVFLKKHWPFLLYAFLILAGIFFHEIWLDEAQSLLIGQTAKSYWELIGDARYEGQPFLWFALMRFISFDGVNPIHMQIFNAFTMIAMAAIFWWRFPLPRNIRSLFLFNFFFLFEFGLIARPYGLGMLLLFFGIAFMVDKRLWLRNASFLSFLLLSQTTIYGVFILVGVLFYKFSREFPKNKKQSLYEILMATVLIVFSAWQVWEPSDAFLLNQGWQTKFGVLYLLETLKRFGQAFVYIPSFKSFPYIWENFSDTLVSKVVKLVFMVFALVTFGKALWSRDKKLLIGFLLSFLCLFVFLCVKNLNGQRYTAHIVILFAAFYWLADRVRSFQFENHHLLLFKIVGVLSVVGGGTLYAADLFFPFSDAKNASVVLQENRDFTIVWPDYSGPALSAYLDGRDLFHFEGMKEGTYVEWNTKRATGRPPALEDFEVWLKDRGIKSFIFVSNNSAVADFLTSRFIVDRLYSSNLCIVRNECYEIMRVNVKGSRRQAQPPPTRRKSNRELATDVEYEVSPSPEWPRLDN